MGIRYERGNHRATNGPMIFFSITKDEAFEEEIRSAFLTGLSFYAYRYPNDSMLTFGSSESYLEGLGTPGFVIGMFHPRLPYFTIPYKDEPNKSGKKEPEEGSFYSMAESSTPYAEYVEEIDTIVRELKKNNGKKVVAARVIVKEDSLDIAEKFYELSKRFPEAFIFCFSTPATGCWIGASPELLLNGQEGTLRTMGLAGTRLVGDKTEWDSKNIEEQKIVVDYISDIFRRNGIMPESGPTYTKPAGRIEHICTEIKGCYPENISKENRKEYLLRLMKELSPTPALCGEPKEYALSMINSLEHFDRGCYGGFCGPYHSPDEFNFQVVLRCGSVSEKRYCVYVGGGITSKSLVEKEWEETRIKSETFLGKL